MPMPERRCRFLAVLIAAVVAASSLSAQGLDRAPINLKELLNPPRRPSAADAAKQEERCQALQRWANQLLAAHLDVNLNASVARGANIAALEKLASELFVDEAFVPTFGKPYDSLTTPELQALKTGVLDPCANRLPWQLGPVHYAFGPREVSQVIVFGHARLAPYVVADRDTKRARAAEPAAPSPSREGPPARVATAASVVPQYPRRQLPALSSKRNETDRCELIMTWLGRHAAEEKLGNLDHGGLPLFRDEDFVPLFGQPYDRTTAEWRKDVYDDVIARCGRNRSRSTIDLYRPLTTYAEQFAWFDELMRGAFLEGHAKVSPMAVTNAVIRGRQSRAWTETILAGAFALPNTEASFATLSQQLRPIQSDARSFFWKQQPELWPSEQTHFTDLLEQRLTQIASAVTTDWLSAFERSEETLHAITGAGARLRSSVELLAAADPAIRENVESRAFARMQRIADAVADARVAELAGIPATMAGVERSAALKARFDADFIEFSRRQAIDQRDDAESKMIQARLNDLIDAATRRADLGASTQRRRILTGALPEWEALIASRQSLAALQPPARFLRDAFIASERSGDLYRTYERSLVAKAGLNTSGMTYPSLATDIYLGRFRLLTANSFMDGNKATRYALEGYVVQFSERCHDYLPADRREIIRVETESLVDRFGITIVELRRTRTPTGVFAAPEFAEAYVSPNPSIGIPGAGEMLKAFLVNPNPLGPIRRMVQTSFDVRADVDTLLERHGCDSAATKRFADNLLRLAQGREAVSPILD